MSERAQSRTVEEVLPEIYAELHGLASRYLSGERIGHTLQTTALVHEAYLRLSGSSELGQLDRGRFLCAAATAMRRILVNHARDRGRVKRGGAWLRVPLDEGDLGGSEREGDGVVALDRALDRLAEKDARKARVVELRYFGGCSREETAEALGVSVGTVKNDWALARAWLARELAREGVDE